MKRDVEQEWLGKTAFILGGGMSMWLYDLRKLRGLNVIAVNTAFKIYPIADFLVYLDKAWFDRNAVAVKTLFKGRTVSLDSAAVTEPDVLFVRGVKRGVSFERNTINHGENSGFAALNLAVHLGATRIVLLAFDMRFVNGKGNFHDEHVRRARAEVLLRFITSFDTAAQGLREKNVTVLNATPHSALKCFPETDFEVEVLNARKSQ